MYYGVSIDVSRSLTLDHNQYDHTHNLIYIYIYIYIYIERERERERDVVLDWSPLVLINWTQSLIYKKMNRGGLLPHDFILVT